MNAPCDWHDCDQPATTIWHNGMDIYCAAHYDEAFAAHLKAAELTTMLRKEARLRREASTPQGGEAHRDSGAQDRKSNRGAG
jgi:hypothetical protein